MWPSPLLSTLYVYPFPQPLLSAVLTRAGFHRQVILTLTTLRHTTAAERSVRRGEWTSGGSSIANKTMGVSQVGRTVGILGMGSIGKIAGRYLAGMGMKVIYHNRRELSEDKAGGAEYISSLDEVRPFLSSPPVSTFAALAKTDSVSTFRLS